MYTFPKKSKNDFTENALYTEKVFFSYTAKTNKGGYHMCMYVCMYVCIYVCMYAHTHVHAKTNKGVYYVFTQKRQCPPHMPEKYICDTYLFGNNVYIYIIR